METKHVGIVGSGIMGAGIAEVAAKAGFDVTVRSRSQESADSCRSKIGKSLGRQVEKGKLTADDAKAIMGRIRAVTDLAELEYCDLVLESVVEDLGTKKQLFSELDAACSAGTVLATNTSTLPILELAVSVSRADRVLGMHFFNPASVMPLVEVVPALTTSPETFDAAWQFALACGKTPVKSKDQAGFIVNALLFPYLNAAIRMLESDVASKEDIDTAMKGGCGFPMGPFELLDLIGLDTSLAVLERLYEERREPGCVPAGKLRQMVMARQLGRKTGGGFYTYPAPAASKVSSP
ncbi:MAG: 3-hydroxybutyryl-CoA dehydrogenase [Actinobacteria bacterium]|nr:MAG: 3-hydroxybutyryl-CoA dehydrogenase [Actinomycetota bacterium]